MTSKPPFYITTAIDYPNGKPHIGHAYEKVITDCYARWYKLKTFSVNLTTGTDENGQKLTKSAESVSMSTKDFVDKNVVFFKDLAKALNIDHTDFIRSTENRHKVFVHQFWKKLEKNGDIYAGEYSGEYCINCEAFYTDSQSVNGQCPTHGTELESINQKGYFFKLSKYQNWIIDFIKENPSFIHPSNIRKEILSRLESEEIIDLSISRPNTGWGITVPGNENFVVYTWFDALICYYTSAKLRNEESVNFWPANMHVIGKDITWFHAVIWPAMLKSYGDDLPGQIYVHGMVLGHDGKRMSKSLGNGVDPIECLELVPSDSFRYYLLKSIPSGQDGIFNVSHMIQAHNSELANDFGNLAMRIIKLSQKSIGKIITPEGPKYSPVALYNSVDDLMEKREHNKALSKLWEEVRELNTYLNYNEPWKIKDNPVRFHEIMYHALVRLYFLVLFLKPFIPESCDKILSTIGASNLDFNLSLAPEFTLEDLKPLFPKIDTDA